MTIGVDEARILGAVLVVFGLCCAFLFAVLALPLCMLRFLERLKQEPPRTLFGWCRRFSGWALLVVACIGGGLSLSSWAADSRIGETPLWCFFRVAEKGVLGTSGPGLETYLDELTDGTSGDAMWDGANAPSRARLYFLVTHTRLGKCAPVDKEKFLHWVHKMSAERDWTEAHYLLALHYGYGRLADGEVGAAGRYAYSIATSSGHMPAWANDRYRISAVADGKGGAEMLDAEKSFALLEKSAAGGYGDAQWFLSNAYAAGFWGRDNALALGADYEKSTRWLEKFAQGSEHTEDDHRDAFYTLGHRYHRAAAYGLQRDDAKAYAYMTKVIAGERRHDKAFDAMLELALMHQKGIGAPPSVVDARAWLEKAAAELARMEEEGRKAQEMLSEDADIALVRAALAEKRRKFEETSAQIDEGAAD